MYIPDPRIAPYLAALDKPASWVSQTSLLLYRLGVLHGHVVIDQLLNEHWKKVRHEKEVA